MKTVLASMVLLFGGAFAQAQSAPTLQCGVRYKDQVKPMYWFAGNSSHHADAAFDLLSVIVKEKSEPGKYEITIVEMTDDEVWDKFSEITNAADLTPEMRTKIRALGRTRITTAYVGLYKDFLHFEHRLGKDPNVYEVSCRAVFPKS